MERTRNVGIITHINVGKTITTECILHYTGVNYEIGDTHEGTAITDQMAWERERGITITPAATTCHWTLQENYKPKPGASEYRINIIDTPGHIDFTVEVERSPHVLDGAVGVFCVKGGVESQPENVWRWADTYNVPRTAFINKMNALGANFYGAVDQIKIRLGKDVICIQLPVGKEDDFGGTVGLLEMKAYTHNGDKGDDISIIDIPEDMKNDAELYHSELVEKIRELDDDLMMAYLRGEEPSNNNLKKALGKATYECVAIPTCCGTAYRDKSVQKLLDAVIEFMPSSLNIPSIKDTDLDDNEIERHSSDNESSAALTFKIITDPFAGKLAFFRVRSGDLNFGSYVLNTTKGKKERIGHIPRMHTSKRSELGKVYPGDTVAAVGFKATSTDDTICDEKNLVILESMESPEPVIDIVVEPKTKASQDKMSDALIKLAEEDPTFHVRTNGKTGRAIISDTGELYLDIIVDRLLHEFNVEVNIGAPRVAHKKTLIETVDANSKYAEQSGGCEQYGHCEIHFTSMETDAEETFKLTSSVVGSAIPEGYIPAVEEGIEEACKTGILGGFPVLGVHADVYNSSCHEVNSSEMVFHIAGPITFKETMQKGSPILLEPTTKVEVTMPEEYMGDVIGDINPRRGRIEDMEDIGGGKMVKAYVSLSEMSGHPTDLRSRTQGRGNYSILFKKYEPVLRNAQKEVSSDHKK